MQIPGFKQISCAVTLAAAALIAGCGGDNGPDLPVPLHLDVDFNLGVAGWQSGIADYTAGTEPSDVKIEAAALPAPLKGNGYYVGGHNRSDDAFLYFKKKFSGLHRSTKYKVTFSVQIASDQPANCSFGVGGSPADSVYVIAGAAPTEPKTVLVNADYRVNLDRGNQAQSGPFGQTLGTIATANAACANVFESKTLKSSAPLTIESDANGDMWFFFGMDSGFEATSRIYFQTLSVDIVPL